MSYGGSWAGFTGAHSNAQDNTARAWWQSQYRLARPPQLTDLRALARAIRGTP
jgi:hypothetical protein